MTLRGNNRCLVAVSSFITAQRVAEGIGERQGKEKQSLLAPDQEKKPESDSEHYGKPKETEGKQG